MTRSALLVGVDDACAEALDRALGDAEIMASRARTLEEARTRLAQATFHATVVDAALADDAASSLPPARGALVVLSALPGAPEVARWLERGVDAVLTGPFDARSAAWRVGEIAARSAAGLAPLAHVPGPRGPDGAPLGPLDVEASLRDLLDATARLLDVPIVLVTELQGDRQLLRLRVGVEAESTARDDAFCAYTVAHGGAFVVEDAQADARFRDNPLVVGEPGVRFYAGIPITVAGRPTGALCVIDRRPRTLGDAEERHLTALARHVGEVSRSIASRAWAEALLEDAPGWIQSVDGDGVIRFANAAWRQGLGYANPVGTRMLDLIAPEDRTRMKQRVLEARERGVTVSSVFRLLAADGSFMGVTAETRWVGGGAGRTITVLQRPHRDAPAGSVALDDVAEALRGPLATMRGTLGLLRGALDGGLREVAAEAETEGQRVADVVEDLATLGAAVRGTLSLPGGPVSLAAVLGRPGDPEELTPTPVPGVGRALSDLARDVGADPSRATVSTSPSGKATVVVEGPGAMPTSAGRIAVARAVAVLHAQGCHADRSESPTGAAWAVTLPPPRRALSDSGPRMRLLVEAIAELRRELLESAPGRLAAARDAARAGAHDAAAAELRRLEQSASAAGLHELATAVGRVTLALEARDASLDQRLREAADAALLSR
ncbi:MAG: GAF domain-containing protein [Polyangiaceae bacterium]|nr:GAF domain-containing protein [Polyangiaceae bacterium]